MSDAPSDDPDRPLGDREAVLHRYPAARIDWDWIGAQRKCWMIHLPRWEVIGVGRTEALAWEDARRAIQSGEDPE